MIVLGSLVSSVPVILSSINMFYDSTPANSDDNDEYPEPAQVAKDTNANISSGLSILDTSNIVLDKIKSKDNYNDFSLTPTPHNANNGTENNEKKRKVDGEFSEVENHVKKKKKKHDKKEGKSKKPKKSKKHKVKKEIESPTIKSKHKKSKKDKKKKKKHKLQTTESVIKLETISDSERNSMNSDITMNSSKLQEMFNYLDEITGIYSDDNCTSNKSLNADGILNGTNKIGSPSLELNENVLKSQELTASLQPVEMVEATRKESELSHIKEAQILNNSEHDIAQDSNTREVSSEPLKEIVNKSIDNLIKMKSNAQLEGPRKANTKKKQSRKNNHDLLNKSEVLKPVTQKKNSRVRETKSLPPMKSGNCVSNGIEHKENSANGNLDSVDEVIDSLLKFDVTMECEDKDISESIIYSKRDSETSSSHGSEEDHTNAELNSEETDLQIFEDLMIDHPFDLCELHCIETRVSAPPTIQQLHQIQALELNVKKGIYSFDEDTLIKNNWVSFCEHHHIPPKPELFVNFKHQLNGKTYKLNSSERLKFVQFLARGLHNRLLCSVYKRFQTIFTVLKRGRFEAEEDEIILEVLNNSKSNRNIFARLSQELGRDKLAIEKRVTYLRKQKENQYNACRLTTDISEELIKALLTEMKLRKIKELKGITLPSDVVSRVSKSLNIREEKLRLHWYATLHPKLFVVGTRNMCAIKIRLIELILTDKSVKSPRDIDYNKIIDSMDGWTILGLRKLLGNMIHNNESLESSFRSTLKKLKEKFLLEISNSAYLKVAKYSHGNLILREPDEDTLTTIK